MSEFEGLLARFAKAVEANDGKGLAALFTPDGTYVDYFFGPYTGPQAIADMLQHFHDGGSDYQWQFFDPVSDGNTAYARYCFSYKSILPESKGKPVVFDGMSCFKLENGKIKHYSEVFDRGGALAQLDFAAERIKKSLGKWAGRFHSSDAAKAHLDRLRKAGAA
jgi:ketosteroid isomerase-like protein